MEYEVIFHDKVFEDDLPRLPKEGTGQITRVIDGRLTTSPLQIGKPLSGNLKGFRRVRVGDFRIVYKVAGNKVIVVIVDFRKTVYKRVLPRI